MNPGGMKHELARRRRTIDAFEGMWHDIAYAARSLRRAPAVSLTIIITLALGLGVNAAMFSLLDVIFLRPPAGVEQPSAMRRVWAERRFSSGAQYWSGFDYTQFEAISKAIAGHADATLYRWPEEKKLGRGENVPKATVAPAAASYFPLLGVKPQLGRFYQPDEDRLDAATPVAVISDTFWKRQFGGAPDVLNREFTIEDRKFTIIGIAPPMFSGTELDATDVWLPIAWTSSQASSVPWWRNPNVNGFQVLLRLHPSAPETALTGRTTAALRGPNVGYRQDTLTVAAFGSVIVARGPGRLEAEMRVATRLVGVAIIVLLIACANVVNLLLARAVKRRREIAVRLTLGVSRFRLVRMLVTESLMLAAVAVVAAMLAATWGGALLRTLLTPEVHFAGSPLHWRVLAFAMATAFGAGAVAGLIPALQAASPDLTTALKAGSHAGSTNRPSLRSALVIAQAALSVVLLVGAVLFMRSLSNVKSRDIGYTVDRLAFARVTYDVRDSTRDAAQPARLRALEPRIAAIPGVERVAFTSMRPLNGMQFVDYFPEPSAPGRALPSGIVSAVSPGYFEATGTRLLRGQTFSSDPGANAPYTVIINQAMADALWPRLDPIGRCIHFNSVTTRCANVIGVAQTAMLVSTDEKPEPHFYVSLDHPPIKTWGASDVIVRAAPSRLADVRRSVDKLLRAEFPGAVPGLKTMAEVMEPRYRPWQLGATLFTLFGALALLVAAIGIYSSVSYAVTQRTHEFGVRVALGARTADVLGQVLGEGLRTAVVGVAIGILMALAAGRLVASLLYGISPSDPLAIVLVAVTLLAIALIASLLPAWRATKADPMSALRAD
jgi:predicted permease